LPIHGTCSGESEARDGVASRSYAHDEHPLAL
jgi:hypothetical protein